MFSSSLIKTLSVLVFSLMLNPVYANNLTTEKLVAAYVQKFTNYIDWPETNKPDFTIAVLNNQLLQKALVESFADKEYKNKKVTILDIKKVHLKDVYDILFVEQIDSSLAPHIKSINRDDMLIITQDENGLNQYSNINFFIYEGKLRFDINTSILKESHLKINSRLLNLAKNYK